MGTKIKGADVRENLNLLARSRAQQGVLVECGGFDTALACPPRAKAASRPPHSIKGRLSTFRQSACQSTRGTPGPILLTLLGALFLVAAARAGQPAPDPAPRKPAAVYVPYADLASVVDPAAKAVLMDKADFQKLLDAAHLQARPADLPPGAAAAEVMQAEYAAEVVAGRANITGKLDVRANTDKPVALPLPFGQIGLTSLTCDGQPAPLGYDGTGRLVLIVSGNQRKHTVTLEATALLKDLASGGSQFAMSVPPAAAGTLAVSAGGDLDIVSNAPLLTSPATYDKQADRTAAKIAVGGYSAVTILLLGNGRQDDVRAILLGESVTQVRLSPVSQDIQCLYSVQILRRAVRELRFAVPTDWTISDVACDNLVKWSIETGKATQTLVVQLAGGNRTTVALHIQATAPMGRSTTWTSPLVSLVGGDFQRGFISVDSGAQLRIRGPKVADARQMDPQDNRALARWVGSVGGAEQWFYHWGDSWSVRVGLAAVKLGRSSDDRQTAVVGSSGIVLAGTFTVTAVGREMFDVAFELPPAGWDLAAVTVNDQPTGFQYHVSEAEQQHGKSALPRVLRVELASAVPPERAVRVSIALRHVPGDWDWSGATGKNSTATTGPDILTCLSPETLAGILGQPDQARPRSIVIPLISPMCDTVSGVVGIVSTDDLDVTAFPPDAAIGSLKPISVGRMVSLGLGGNVRLGYTYEATPDKPIDLTVSRLASTVRAASIGMASLASTGLSEDWLIQFFVARGRVNRLYLLADKAMGPRAQAALQSAQGPAGLRIISRRVVLPGEKLAGLPAATESLRKNYDLWELTLDADCVGLVPIRVHYDQPVASTTPLEGVGSLSAQPGPNAHGTLLSLASSQPDKPGETVISVPLIRPANVDQADELVAVGASPGFAGTVAVEAKHVTEIDTIELPQLPDLPANRLLAAFRIGTATGAAGAEEENVNLPQISLVATAHSPYELAGAIVTQADLVTLLGPPGETTAATDATFHVANAALQFFRVQLPAGATLWSIRLNGQVIKPSRDTEGHYLVPLPAARQANSCDIRVVYADKAVWSDRGRVTVATPILPDAQISRATWKLVPTVGFHVDPGPARMEAAESGRPRLAIVESLGDLGGSGKAKCAAQMKSLDLAANNYAHDYSSTVMVPDRGDVVLGGQRMADHISAPSSTPDGIEAPRIVATGRVTLPIDLPAVSEEGSMTFTGLGLQPLTVDVVEGSRGQVWQWMGVVLTCLLGLVWINRRPGRKARLILTVLVLATSAALVSPPVTLFANGAFYAAAALIPFYILVGVFRWFCRMIAEPAIGRIVTLVKKGTARTLLLAMVLAISFGSPMRVQAGGAAAEPPASPAPPGAIAPIVIPYDGDPLQADKSKVNKVLVPFDRFVELWNRAHPERPMFTRPEAGRLLISAAKFEAAVVGDKLDVTLSATISTQGLAGGWAELPLPMENLAVTEATLDGKPVKMQTVMVPLTSANPSKIDPNSVAERPEIHLLLQGDQSGKLVVKAVGTAKVTGQRGAIALALPPMPAAVMTLKLPAEDLLLETEGSDGVIVQDKATWTIPLNLASRLSLKWSPKSAGTSADRTLSATAEHSVYAFDWALVGVSKLSFTFSAGDYDRFSIFVPADVTVTDIAGANFRDQRVNADAIVLDGRKFREISVRLYKPASRQQDFTIRWLAKLPAGLAESASNATQPDTQASPMELLLPRAGGVGRESGTVALFAASGVTMQVTDVAGGRQVDRTVAPPIAKPTPAAGEKPAEKTPSEQPIGESASAVGQYFWPYRPFSIKVRLSRPPAAATARLDQLVRVTAEQTQLLVSAALRATSGKVFSANFRVPDGYDVLNVTGANVGDWYIEPAATPAGGRQLHVALARGAIDATVVIVCVKPTGSQGTLDPFTTPMLTAIDADGNTLRPGPGETSRLAVQVAAAMDSNTLASENLKSVAPAALSDWLDGQQVAATQFAYRYETPTASLQLAIHPRAGKVRAEITTSLAIQPGDPLSAWYTCRLRYTIDGAPVDRVAFDLPEPFSRLAALNPSPAIRSVSQAEPAAGRVRWTVLLANELTGQLDLTLNFVVPVDRTAQSSTLDVPRVSTSAPDGYRAIVAVQNFSRHDLSITGRNRLTELSSASQQALLGGATRPGGSTGSLVGAFESFTDDWSLSLKLTPVATVARPKIVVDLMAVTSVLDLDGNARYRVTLTVSNRTEQFLPVYLPRGFRVWSADVAGVPVRPVVDPQPRGYDDIDAVLVPLVKTGGFGQPYDVRLLLAGQACGPLGSIATLSLPPVRVGGNIQVVRSTWSVRLPAGFTVVTHGGNMSPVAGKAELLDYKLQAGIDNLGRLLESRSENFSGSSRGQWAEDAWVAANKKLDREVAEADSYLRSAEAGEIDKDAHERIAGKLKGLKDAAEERRTGWAIVANKERELNGRNYNFELNGTSQFTGQAEFARNSGLTAIPQFVQDAGRAQSAEVGKELSVAKEQVATLDQKSQDAKFPKQIGPAGKQGKDQDEKLALRNSVRESLVPYDDREKAVSVDTQSLLAQAEQADTVGKLLEETQLANAKQQEAKLSEKQASLTDNRMQRFYASQAGNGQYLANQSLGQFQDNGGNWQDQNGVHNINAPVSGTSSRSQTFSGTVVENGNLPTRDGNTLGTLTAQNTGGAALIINGGGTVTVNGNNAINNTNAWSTNGYNSATGSLSVGAGTITLNGNNTFSGGTTLNSGTVVVNNSGQINWNPNSYADLAANRQSGPNGPPQSGQPNQPAWRNAAGQNNGGTTQSLSNTNALGNPSNSYDFNGATLGRPTVTEAPRYITESQARGPVDRSVTGHATPSRPQGERQLPEGTLGVGVVTAENGGLGVHGEGSYGDAVRTGGTKSDSRTALVADRSGSMGWSGGESAPARSAGLVAAEIELPAGGVELDYACPSGQPELALTIVRQDVVTAGWGLATGLIGLSVLALAAMVARRIRRRA